jgi:hypothetical protein
MWVQVYFFHPWVSFLTRGLTRGPNKSPSDSAQRLDPSRTRCSKYLSHHLPTLILTPTRPPRHAAPTLRRRRLAAALDPDSAILGVRSPNRHPVGLPVFQTDVLSCPLLYTSGHLALCSSHRAGALPSAPDCRPPYPSALCSGPTPCPTLCSSALNPT